jgi:hypothetical protein
MAKSKENKNKPKLNLAVREEQDGVDWLAGWWKIYDGNYLGSSFFNRKPHSGYWMSPKPN